MNKTHSKRLKFDRFYESDIPALAELLADPGITRNITANGSTRERCLASAARRIDWHNSTWDEYGYGVWALRSREPDIAPVDLLLGWCGFIPPDDDEPDPEILYAIRDDYRGQGFASEAAKHAISWLFNNTSYRGITAVISTPLNPGSVNVVTKLGMEYRTRMPFSLFLSGNELADEVTEYEIWRLSHGPAEEPDSLIEQVGFRAGQLSTVSSLSVPRILDTLSDAVSKRFGDSVESGVLQHRLEVLSTAFRHGCNDAFMDCYHVTRDRWSNR